LAALFSRVCNDNLMCIDDKQVKEQEMPRRPSHKIGTEAVGTDSAKLTTIPKKRQPVVRVVAIEVDATVQPTPSAKSPKTVKTEVGLDSESLDTDQESGSGIKIQRVKVKESLEKAQAPKQRPRKRTATVDDDEDSADGKKAKKATKKRKTEKEKEVEAMPLAIRTAVATLKHAMHVGAHISAAGGKSSWSFNAALVTYSLIIYRCPELSQQCTSYWW
jgi:AP endonuclease-1